MWVCSLVEAIACSGHGPVWIDVEEDYFEVFMYRSSGAGVLCQGQCRAMRLLWDGVGVGVRLWEQIGSSGTR